MGATNEPGDENASGAAPPGAGRAVREATRSLLRLRTGGDARRVAEHLVRELGGQLVPAGTDDPSVIPVDVSFGDGQPLLAAAPLGSAARALSTGTWRPSCSTPGMSCSSAAGTSGSPSPRRPTS